MDMCKGLVWDDRWNWDDDCLDWDKFRWGFNESSVLKTTLAVFLNTLEMNQDDTVANYQDARFRALQYFRTLVDNSYSFQNVEPPFQSIELEEPDWRIWG